MATPEPPHCNNPFFLCINKEKELRIQLDIQIKNEKYSICPTCWQLIAESENYQWTQPETQKTENQPFTPEWKHQDTDTTQD